VFSDHIE